ncbi:hypothetical protein L1887_59056 [Cichorium endivia]|nr:hypothetical protein L1887_59056 [Cichorium endivia]
MAVLLWRCGADGGEDALNQSGVSSEPTHRRAATRFLEHVCAVSLDHMRRSHQKGSACTTPLASAQRTIVSLPDAQCCLDHDAAQ